jgi:phage protein D
MLTPAYKLTFGQKAGDSGGVLGAATSVGESTLGVSGSGKVVVDTTDEPKASTITDLTVRLDLDTPADSFTLMMGNVGGFKPKPDDETKIELGYADNGGLTQVMAATVAAVEPNLTTTRVVGLSAAQALLHTFVGQTYESKTAGEIVSDLADKAKVELETADDGINFPAYVTDGRRSAFHHMQEIAALCGFDLYINADGKLVFEEFVGGKTVHVFEFAKHIIALNVARTPALAAQIQAWGESPTGSAGDDASAWLTTDFSGSKGVAGSGAPVLLLERPALRTAAAARTAANATMINIQRQTLRGRVLSLGRPEVKLGDAIRLSEMTDDSLNTTFQVRSVTHRITKVGGFTTTIGFRAIET